MVITLFIGHFHLVTYTRRPPILAWLHQYIVHHVSGLLPNLKPHRSFLFFFATEAPAAEDAGLPISGLMGNPPLGGLGVVFFRSPDPPSVGPPPVGGGKEGCGSPGPFGAGVGAGFGFVGSPGTGSGAGVGVGPPGAGAGVGTSFFL